MNDSKLLEMVQVFETECEKLTSKEGKNEKRLKPFAHQVSGTAHFLKYDENTVMKSLSAQEWNFYDKCSTLLHPFIPEIEGLALVKLDKNTSQFENTETILRHSNISNKNNCCKMSKRTKDNEDVFLQIIRNIIS